MMAYPEAVRIIDLDDSGESLRESLLSHADSAKYVEKAKDYSSALIRSLERISDFDLVHAHDWLTFEAALEIKRLTGKPLVVHIHSTEEDRSTRGLVNPVVATLERKGMDAADRIVTVSRYAKERLARQYGQPLEKVELIYNATARSTEVPVRLPSSKVGSITFLGRITEQKGPKAFVEAARGICSVVPNARFVMAGDGDLLPMIHSLVNKLGMTEFFSFPGFLNQEEVVQLLGQSRVLLMPSLSEPFGLVALEAIRAGVPVVLSKYCGLIEHTPSVIRVDPMEVQEIVDATISILRDPVKAQARAQVVAQEAAHLDWTVSAKRLLLVYRAALARNEAMAAGGGDSKNT